MNVIKHSAMDIIGHDWPIIAVAFCISLIITPLVRFIAYKLKAVDRPDDMLKPHGRPIAYLGGIAMCIGLLAGLATFVLISPDRGSYWQRIIDSFADRNFTALMLNPMWNLFGVAAGSIAITIVGLFDDLRGIKPRQKVFGQMLAAGILLAGGIGHRIATTIMIGPIDLSLAPWILTLVSAILCLIMVILTCNATNLLDGLDGLCGGVTGIITLGFLMLAIWLAMWGHAPPAGQLRVGLCLAMAGAVLGFLPYNIPPASIFMGDAGSMLLGFFVAAMMALFCQEHNTRWFLASVGIFALPIVDTGLAVIRRFLGGQSIFAGDRSHLYDQLVDRGMSVKKVVVLFYLLAAVAAIVAVDIAIFLRTRHALIVYAVCAAGIIVFLYMKGMITPPPRLPSPVAGAKKILKILFTSAGRRVSLLREFHRAAKELEIKLDIHAADSQNLAPAMQVADHTTIAPTINSGQYIEHLLDYCRHHEIDALIPLIDTELLVLSEARQRFAEVGTRAIISSPRVERTVKDKILTAEFLAGHGFLTPRILTGSELDSAKLPLFTKPRFGSSSLEIHKINTPEELAFFRDHKPNSIIQEFIEGIEHTVDVFADFDGKALCAVPRRRYEVRGGEVTKAQTIRHKKIIEQSLRLVETLGECIGMITVQCFLTPDDRVVFIEINPRFGGGVPLSIYAGADSPKWLIEMLLGREPKIKQNCWTDQILMLRYDQGIFVTPDLLP